MSEYGMVSLAVGVVHVGIESDECLEDLESFLDLLLFESQFDHVAGAPEHGDGGVVSLVGGVHGAYRLVCLFYLSLLSQFENVFYFHSLKVGFGLYGKFTVFSLECGVFE